MDNLERRLKLHAILCEIMGSNNVYYQPPEDIRMKYPCIVYSHDRNEISYADNRNYIKHNRYSITLIDRDPDSGFRDKIEELQYCTFDRYFSSDNLNHFNYTLYY